MPAILPFVKSPARADTEPAARRSPAPEDPAHTTIIAREFGIPPSLPPGGTGVLRDGQQVIVDGSTGTVRHTETRPGRTP
jgi:hypothetical protein